MSDERLYLRCGTCGSAFKLASIYHDDVADKVPPSEALKVFLNEHLDRSTCGAWDWYGDTVGFFLDSEQSTALSRSR